jgi:hypothetical protein
MDTNSSKTCWRVSDLLRIPNLQKRIAIVPCASRHRRIHLSDRGSVSLLR